MIYPWLYIFFSLVFGIVLNRYINIEINFILPFIFFGLSLILRDYLAYFSLLVGSMLVGMYLAFKPVVDIKKDSVFIECISLDVPNKFDSRVTFDCNVINSDVKTLIDRDIKVYTDREDVFILSRVAFLGKIKSEDGLIKAYPKRGFLEVDNSSNPLFIIKVFKDKLIENYRYKALNDQTYNLGLGLIFGERGSISNQDYQRFVESGLAHMLAISGSHVAILIFSLTIILFFVKQNLRYAIILAVLPFYAIFTGFTVPVVRASVVGMLYAISKVKYFKFNSLNVLFFVGFVYLLFSPESIFSVSFQLSFIAALSIIIGIDIFKDRNVTLSVLGVSFIATLFTAPIVMYHFGNVSLNSILSTPIATLPMYPYLTFAILNLFTGFSIDFLIKIMDGFGMIFLDVVYIFEKLPFYFIGFKPSLFIIFLFYISFIIILLLNIRLNRKILLAFLTFLLFAFVSKSDKNQFVIYSFKSTEYPVVFVVANDRCYLISDYPVFKQLSLFNKEGCEYRVLITEKPERFKDEYLSGFDKVISYTYQVNTLDFLLKKWVEYRLYTNSKEYIITNQDGAVEIE